jgi:tetratricopeptide (TPR) repeat protein
MTRDEAVAAAEKARRLSPIDPFQYFYESLSATVLMSAGRYEEALIFADSSLQRSEWHISTWRTKIVALHYLERHAEAQDAARQLLARQPDFNIAAYRHNHPAADYKFGRRVVEALSAAGIP